MTLMQRITPENPTSLQDWIAPECTGQNFYDIDRSLQDLLTLYLPADLLAHLEPHYRKLGELSGNRLDELSRLADRHPPQLHLRDRMGREQDWLEFHPAYREMEQIGYGDFGIHCMSRVPGALGWADKVPSLAKYAFQYLFTQSEFSLMCPISATETSGMLIDKFGSDELKQKLLPRMWTQDMGTILKGAQFMTEHSGGSDVSNIALEARFEDGEWRLYGEKFFCSCADGDVAMILARPAGAAPGNAGIALFAMPRHLDDGSRNKYQIIRLKDKLGTRGMASGEIKFFGALAYPLGEVGSGTNQGLKQMLHQVNYSRLSHGVRVAGIMRRCLNESLMVAHNRQVGGEVLTQKPLLRRQLMKMLVPTEEALSMMMFTGQQLERSEAGDETAKKLTRILTPLLKFRTNRDCVAVATAAMETRGGCGYMEDWVNPKLVRDSLIGVLWEGTSNINALDVTTRAVAKAGAHVELRATAHDLLDRSHALPGQYRGELGKVIDRAFDFADEVGRTDNQPLARAAADALYHATAAAVMAWEGSETGRNGGDARRLLISRMIVNHRLNPTDPLHVPASEDAAIAALLSDTPVTLDRAEEILAG